MLGKSRPSQEIMIKTDGEGESEQPSSKFWNWWNFILAPNQTPTNVRIEVLSSRSLRVKWQMAPGSLQNVEGFYVGFKLLDETSGKKSYSFKNLDVSRDQGSKTDFEIILNDLQRNSRYNIIIQAFNKKGPGRSSEDVVGQTSEFGTCSSFPPFVCFRSWCFTKELMSTCIHGASVNFVNEEGFALDSSWTFMNSPRSDG